MSFFSRNFQDEKKADKKLAIHLSDYDYLVGMALIRVSEEEKDKLLAEKETKLQEVGQGRGIE